MVCQVRYLSSAGIQQREVKGLDALAKAFPSNWLVYASLNAFPKNSPPIEIVKGGDKPGHGTAGAVLAGAE